MKSFSGINKVGVGVGVTSSVQIIKVALDNVPASTTAKSWIYNDQVPFEFGGCIPSNTVNSGELPGATKGGTGQGALNVIEFCIVELLPNVPELNPFQSGVEKDVNVTVTLVAVVTPPILPAINE